MTYLEHLKELPIPQSQPLSVRQVKNNAGGYVFPIDKWERLSRFLILGSEGGTYYVSERDLTKQDTTNIKECIKENGVRVVKEATRVSDNGLASKNEPAILVLALCLTLGNEDTKIEVYRNVSTICRTGTHILHLASYINELGGWGRAKRGAIGKWYAKDAKNLAYQVVKYQSRDKWSHRDVLRLTHIKALNPIVNAVLKWITKGTYEGEYPELAIIDAFEKAKTADKKTTIELIKSHDLSREMIKTEFLKDKDVQLALLEKTPMTALIRNLGNFSSNGLFDDYEVANRTAIQLLSSDLIKKSRLHPISILLALKQYATGGGFRSGKTWTVNTKILDALNDAFYLAFDNVKPTNKKITIAVDESGSMHSAKCNGSETLTPAEATAALALVISNTEPNTTTLAFNTMARPVSISSHQRLDDVMKLFGCGGGTDCASPIKYAADHRISTDLFVLLTDSQTWSGGTHPYTALLDYRRVMNKPKTGLLVIACQDNAFTVASPEDAYCLDIAGFSADLPTLVVSFLEKL